MEAEEVRPERDREHAGEHEHVAVREVDELEDAVHQRVAQRDERVDGAVRDADQRRLCELRRRDRGLLDEEDDQQDDENPPQPTDERRALETGREGRC
jgi:hypothetical protein